MSADRLAELLRQRALLQEHLAWLDREIAAWRLAVGGPARNEAVPAVNIPAAIKPEPETTRPIVSAEPARPTADVDALLEEYRVPPKTLQQDVRKGCLLYFLSGFLVLGLIVLVLYFALRHD